MNQKTSLLKTGCGAGTFLRAIEPQYDLWGVNFSDQQIKACRQALHPMDTFLYVKLAISTLIQFF